VPSSLRSGSSGGRRLSLPESLEVKPKGISVLSIAIVLEQAPDGTVSSARITRLHGHSADAQAAEKALRPDAHQMGSRRHWLSPATRRRHGSIASAWYHNESYRSISAGCCN
jgi:hypothetical protein